MTIRTAMLSVETECGLNEPAPPGPERPAGRAVFQGSQSPGTLKGHVGAKLLLYRGRGRKKMNQRQVILAVVAVGLVSAALWAWHQSSNNPDATPAHAAASTPANPFSPSASARVAASDAAAPAPAAAPWQAEAAPAAPDVSQTPSAPV